MLIWNATSVDLQAKANLRPLSGQLSASEICSRLVGADAVFGFLNGNIRALIAAVLAACSEQVLKTWLRRIFTVYSVGDPFKLYCVTASQREREWISEWRCGYIGLFKAGIDFIQVFIYRKYLANEIKILFHIFLYLSIMNMILCVCTLDMSELVDDVACLSDSTSEEHSLSSYTSESFDDNGKNAKFTFRIFPFFLVKAL